jgi:hypothetical protein
VDHLDKKLVNLITVIGFGLPIVGYFLFIFHYGVNVPYQDGWSDLTVIHQCYSHPVGCGALWTQHNENRIFVPNILVILLAHTTSFNVRVEEILSGVMLVTATFLLIYAHKRRSPEIPWLYYCPVIILACSVVQYGATLWGFQVAWYLVLLSLALVVFLLDRNELGMSTLAFAIIAGVAGSFSSLQGLLVWPIGILLILYRRRGRRALAIWIVAACVTTAIYYYHLNIHAGREFPSSFTHYSVSPISFAIFAVGDVLGVPIEPGGSNIAIFLLGLAIVMSAIAALALCGLRPDKKNASPVGAVLIWFGLLFAIVVAIGRHGLGYWGASSSGYTIYDMWVIIGIYMVLLDRVPLSARTFGRLFKRVPEVARRNAYRYAPCVVLAVVVLQCSFGVVNGLDGARKIHVAQLRSVATAENIDRASDIKVLDNLSFYQAPSLTRMQVRVAEVLHLTLFAASRHSHGPTEAVRSTQNHVAVSGGDR